MTNRSDKARDNEHRLTLIEQGYETILARIDKLSSNSEILTQEVQKWAYAQKEQNSNVARLHNEFNTHLRDRTVDCPLLNTHLQQHNQAGIVRWAQVGRYGVAFFCGGGMVGLFYLLRIVGWI